MKKPFVKGRLVLRCECGNLIEVNLEDYNFTTHNIRTLPDDTYEYVYRVSDTFPCDSGDDCKFTLYLHEYPENTVKEHYIDSLNCEIIEQNYEIEFREVR